MPIPRPRRGESQEAFLGRCMADPAMNADYPDRDQRFAVCVNQLGGEKTVKQATASRDLRQKLELERYLQRDLRDHNTRLTQEFIRSYASLGVEPNLAGDQDAVAMLLRKHYDRVSGAFGGQVNEQLPSDQRLTTEESALVTAALAGYFDSRSQDQARIIHETTVDDQRQAVIQARADDPNLSIQETAVVAGAILSRWFRAREMSTAITETQAPAEATKATEAEVLSGVQPSVTGGSARAASPRKTWDSVGDNRVRAAHLSADGQSVRVNEPFIVGGEQLMYPGDDSLGASAGNIINCRCGASYDAEAISAQRQRG